MKPDLHKMPDDLLVKYLVGEAGEDEAIQVETWLAQHKDNQVYFDQFSVLWSESILLAPQLQINEAAAWDRFKKRTAERPLKKSLPLYRRMPWLKIAAILIVVAVGGLVYLVATAGLQRKPVEVIAAASSVTSVFPDGSAVVLNKHASIIYPERFDKKERRVKLTGEGFFTVTHNTRQPFIVECNDVNIQVVGTSFNVKSSSDGTEVIVETGRVLVTRNKQTLLLQPGERILVDKKNGDLSKTATADRLYMYYRNHEIICDATPLWKLVQALNEAYDANIVISNKKLDNLPISTTFNNEPLDKILAVIAETLNISVEKKEGSVLLK